MIRSNLTLAGIAARGTIAPASSGSSERDAGILFFDADLGGIKDSSSTAAKAANKTAFQTATTNGGIIFFPEGYWDLTTLGTRTVTEPLHLVGIKGKSIIYAPNTTLITLSGVEFSSTGLTYDHLTSGYTTGRILNIDETTSGLDIYQCDLIDNIFIGCDRAINCSDAGASSSVLSGLRIEGNWFKACRTHAIKLSSFRTQGAIIKENLFTDLGLASGTGRNAIWVGYLDNTTPLITPADIRDNIISNNIIDGMYFAGDPGSTGSYPIYFSGENIQCCNNTIRNFYCIDAAGSTTPRSSGFSNMEVIYCKSSHCLISNNLIENCTGNQGIIAVKGGGRYGSASTGILGYGAVVTNNIIRRKDLTNTALDIVRGIWVQMDSVLIANNRFEGMNGGDIITFNVAAIDANNSGGGIAIQDNLFIDHYGTRFIRAGGPLNNVVIDGNTVDGVLATTANVQFIDTLNEASTDQMYGLVVKNNLIGYRKDAAVTNFRFAVLDVEGDAKDWYIQDNTVLLTDLTFVEKKSAGTLGRLTVTGNSCPNGTIDWYLATAGAITEHLAWNNDNWLTARDTLNLGASVSDGAISSTDTTTVTDAAVGDTVRIEPREALTTGVFLFASVTGANTVTSYAFNKSGGSADLSSIDVVITVEKGRGL